MPGSEPVTNQESILEARDDPELIKKPIANEVLGTSRDNGPNSNVKVGSKNTTYDCDMTLLRLADEDGLKNLMMILKHSPSKKCNHSRINLDHSNWDQYYSFPRLLVTNDTNENHLDPFILQPSLFHSNHVPPTIYFDTKISDNSRPPVGLPKSLQHLYRWKISSITPNSIRNCINFMKIHTIKPSNNEDKCYFGSWCKHMLTAEFSHLEEWKKVNHYPGSFHLGRKDKLWMRLKHAQSKFGKEKFGDFHPTTFVLPRDYEQLQIHWQSSSSNLYIMKPPASARGNGIRVINDIAQIPTSALVLPEPVEGAPTKKSTMIVQQYISNPCLLENGHKFDLRIYVLLTSIDPLRIYVYEEGLVRFASTKYTRQEDGIIDQYMHLTNYFINKQNQDYRINNDSNSLNGCKWTLERFWLYLRENYKHVDTKKLWGDIKDIIIKTIICCEGPMAKFSSQNCKNDYTSYELFGFDIILDENFKPWILEVNITPSLKCESNLDTNVKYGVIKDMFNTVGYNIPPVADTSRMDGLRDSNVFFDACMYTENLGKRDKLKHTKFTKLYKSDYKTELMSNSDLCTNKSSEDRTNMRGSDEKPDSDFDGGLVGGERSNHTICGQEEKFYDNILEDLTPNDIRVLMLSEDELSRSGRFQRVFPSATSHRYLNYFDKPRYYNLLLDSWERKYNKYRLSGIAMLSRKANSMNTGFNQCQRT